MQDMTKIQLREMLLIESSGFKEQFRRPYETHVTQDVVNNIHTRVDQMKGVITPGLFSGLATDFLRPQAAVEGNSAIYIPNGWATPRLYLFLVVDVISGLGTRTELIQGWSDHAELSYNNLVDPRTMFVINSVTTIKNSQQITQYGTQTVQRVVGSHHVVGDSTWRGPVDTPAHISTLRPSDLYARMQMDHQGMDGVLDTRNTLTSKPSTSNRTHGLASNYASSFLNGYSMALSDVPDGSTPEYFASAYGKTADTKLSTFGFISSMSRLAEMGLSNNFTLQSLMQMDPTIYDRGRLVRRAQVQKVSQSYNTFDVNGVENWNGSTVETIAATIIANGLTSIMLNHGLGEVGFSATNNSLMGPVIEYTMVPLGIVGQDVSAVLNSFNNMVQSEILNAVSHGDMLNYNVRVHCAILSATEIEIQLNSNPPVSYTSPTFADAMLAPVLTTNRERLGEVAHDFTILLENTLAQPAVDISQESRFAGI